MQRYIAHALVFESPETLRTAGSPKKQERDAQPEQDGVHEGEEDEER